MSELTLGELADQGRKVAKGELAAPAIESDIIFALEHLGDAQTLRELGALHRHRGLQIISSPGGSAEADEALQVLSRHTEFTSAYEDMYG
jgi:hypothetical protein